MTVSNMIQCVIFKGESQDYTEKKDFNLADLILELEFLFQWKFVQEICILFVQEICAYYSTEIDLFKKCAYYSIEMNGLPHSQLLHLTKQVLFASNGT